MHQRVNPTPALERYAQWGESFKHVHHASANADTSDWNALAFGMCQPARRDADPETTLALHVGDTLLSDIHEASATNKSSDKFTPSKAKHSQH